MTRHEGRPQAVGPPTLGYEGQGHQGQHEQHEQHEQQGHEQQGRATTATTATRWQGQQRHGQRGHERLQRPLVDHTIEQQRPQGSSACVYTALLHPARGSGVPPDSRRYACRPSTQAGLAHARPIGYDAMQQQPAQRPCPCVYTALLHPARGDDGPRKLRVQPALPRARVASAV